MKGEEKALRGATKPPTGPVFCRGGARARRRALEKGYAKQREATSQHGRVMAHRDIELAREWIKDETQAV